MGLVESIEYCLRPGCMNERKPALVVGESSDRPLSQTDWFFTYESTPSPD